MIKNKKIIKRKKSSKSSKFLSLVMLTALFATSVGSVATVFAQEAPQNVQVTITKYVDGEMATSESSDSSDFQMTSTWNAENLGAGSGNYTLSPSSYQAATSEMTSGASYSTNETFDDVVGASCTSETPFALVGYTTGESLSEAENATPTLTPPAFTNITTDKFVIVWNEDCTPVVPTPVEFPKVQINKFIDGEQATSQNSDFLMNATWESTSHGAGTGQYTLNESNDPVAYQTETVEFNAGANYTTNEVVDGTIVSASCTTETEYELVGYTTGNSLSEAMNATPTLTPPAFTNLVNDKFVIVWNDVCDEDNTDEGTIGGDVSGGIDQYGELEVTSIETIDGTATADGSFENGWEYMFNITVPTNETKLAMKFSDWVNNADSSITIAAANNIRISSAQANNGNATVLITAANTYSTPNLNMVTDLDPTMLGLQIKVKVETSVPVNSVNGSYSTNYGVQTTN